MTIAEFQEKGEAALKACLLEVDAVSNLDDLNAFKGRHLGKKSALTGFYQMMRSVDPAERKEFGILLSRLKDKIEAVYAKKASEIEAKLLSEKMARKKVDITLPGFYPLAGAIHPYQKVVREITDFFVGLGFDIADGPEVESDENNFAKMNIPMDHDASGGNSYTLYKDDSFQGMGVFDFAIKLPPVPDGTYELRINNDCMTHGSMLQLYKGRGAKPVASSMTPLGVPLDMRIQMDNWNDPVVVAMGAVPLNDEENYPDAAADKGLESDKVMRTHGFMRGPLSICRQNRPEVITRYVSHQYRKIVDTDVYYQDDYWLRLKTVLDDGNLERKFQIDYIEFVPVGVAQNQQYLEDVY